MNIRLRWCVVLLLAPALTPAAEGEKLIEKAINQLEEGASILASAKDVASAKAAKAKFDPLSKRLEETKKALRKAFPKGKEPDEKDQKRIEQAAKKLFAEINRLDTNAKTYPVFRSSPMFQQNRRTQEQLAHIGAEGLSVQCELYKLNNGNYPANIEDLAKKQPSGGAALVPKTKLRDPWGQLYLIDPAGKNNKGNKADVWSPGHPIEKKKIGNWKDKPAAKDGAKDKR